MSHRNAVHQFYDDETTALTRILLVTNSDLADDPVIMIPATGIPLILGAEDL
jgi:hypothetical protein